MAENQKHASSFRRIILWSAVILGLAGIVWFIFSQSENNKTPMPPPPIAGAPVVPIITVSPEDWSKGPSTAPTVLVEYSDFQCPSCGAYYPLLKQLFDEFGERIRIIYRHFPLKQHTHAEAAARAAEAAGRQGKFWKMHDRLFESQKDWSELEDTGEIFSGFAREIGLDMDRYETDRNSPEALRAIADDFNSELAANVKGTPTFYLNGREIENPMSYKDFRDVIRKVLP